MRAPSLAEFEYVLKGERDLPEAEQTVFILRPLEWRDKERVLAGYHDDLDIGGFLGHCRRVLDAGLVGWRGMLDGDGKDVPFVAVGDGPSRCLSKATLECIPWTAGSELRNAILDGSRTSREAAKNS